ncbi:MAG: hypothetical protein R3F17_03510 [Planctomycetota bacterium]
MYVHPAIEMYVGYFAFFLSAFTENMTATVVIGVAFTWYVKGQWTPWIVGTFFAMVSTLPLATSGIPMRLGFASVRSEFESLVTQDPQMDGESRWIGLFRVLKVTREAGFVFVRLDASLTGGFPSYPGMQDEFGFAWVPPSQRQQGSLPYESMRPLTGDWYTYLRWSSLNP